MVENQSGRKLKILRSDNGGEYVKSEFIQYCKDADIQMQHSIIYTPQQNGVAERKNGSLKEMATCMMEAKNFPPKFWDEAINVHPTSIIGCLISSLMVLLLSNLGVGTSQM